MASQGGTELADTILTRITGVDHVKGALLATREGLLIAEAFGSKPIADLLAATMATCFSAGAEVLVDQGAPRVTEVRVDTNGSHLLVWPLTDHTLAIVAVEQAGPDQADLGALHSELGAIASELAQSAPSST